MIAKKNKSKNYITVGRGRLLTLGDCLKVAEGARVSITKSSFTPTRRSVDVLNSSLERCLPIYGVTTQYGGDAHRLDASISHRKFSDDKNGSYWRSLQNRQLNLIKSLMCGVGKEVEPSVIRTAVLLRLHTLAQGYSGVRPIILTGLRDLLNKNICPIVKQYGSVGASGDLIPLAAIAATLIGEKNQLVFYQGHEMTADSALKRAGLRPVRLNPKEGLALVNGTSFMTAIAALSLYDLKRIFRWMLSAIALTLEALETLGDAYEPLVHKIKGHRGEYEVNKLLKDFWRGSRLIVHPSKLNPAKGRSIQDFYSLRSVPQGFGPFYENIQTATPWIEKEMNSVNDNPIIDRSSQKIYGTANFMGYYVTTACDLLKMDIAQASTWIHALIANLLHPTKSNGLPANLITRPDIYSGFKPIQMLAASLAIQNRKSALAHQAFMIPTEGDNQDVNSLGTHAAFDLEDSVENLEYLVAILLLAGAQAIELRNIKMAGHGAKALFKNIRKVSPFLRRDRPLTGDIEAAVSLIRNHFSPLHLEERNRIK